MKIIKQEKQPPNQSETHRIAPISDAFDALQIRACNKFSGGISHF